MKHVVIGLVLSFAIAVTGCRRAQSAAASSAAEEKTYPLKGEIVSVDQARHVLVVTHEDIPGLMPGMTMEFSVSAGDAANAKAGQRIRAQVIPSKTGNFRLEQIWPDDETSVSAVEAGAKALRQDTMIRGRGAYREVGENMPDFTLYDQNGRVVQAGRFRGKMVMMNFIFTRCPVANMCPAATQKMMATQSLARKAGIKDVEFVSITLDPAYDTPGVLKGYAAERGIDTSNFSFLTGPENAIKDLLAQFGVLEEFDGPLLKHTLATLLISPEGKIIHRADGTVWEPQDFVAKMQR
ncbi:SCO family protein [Horticoccus luteus]|uniref:SCO family protein n=1 Tax=Horticoccus luteus TaxID=2862869 RepID=A0A8F9XKS6_9BACT|nr:SCO family protein [Horticoccus luteus]QYM79988.1 SCO family protein [Horticoccus luteus]